MLADMKAIDFSSFIFFKKMMSLRKRKNLQRVVTVENKLEVNGKEAVTRRCQRMSFHVGFVKF